MKYLLDTNAWLWSVGSSTNLGERTAKLLTTGETADFIRSRLRLARIVALPNTLDHSLAVARLPPFHRDPFDRIIVAQALVEGAILVTSDRRLEEYPIAVCDART